MVAADVDAALRVARLQIELARRLGDLLEHELRIELDEVSPSTVWPAARNSSTASGSRNSIPSSVTIRRQPRSRTSIASSLRIS